ncbi:MAG: diguanylate cyclase [Raoultibacter sp.]
MKKGFSSIGVIISLVIVAGFALSGIISYFSFQSLFQKDVEAVSELTSENIYGNINALMDQPINVSVAMAHDTFLQDFMHTEAAGGLSGEGVSMLKDYLASYQQKYNFDSVFLVSAKTNTYYHYKNGIDRTLVPGDPENTWYFDFLADPAECALNVDNDEASNDSVTIFVNCKLYDEEGKLLGVVGVGLNTPAIQAFLMENENQFDVHAYLIDQQGNIQLSSTLTEFQQVNLFTDDSFTDMAQAITVSTEQTNQRWYHSNNTDGYIITKYVPNLNWYLVVEKNTNDFKVQMISQLGIAFVLSLLVAAIVVAITAHLVRSYDRKMKALAEADQLTGVGNRTSYEREVARWSTQENLSHGFGIGVFDLNNLKKINDAQGHQAGDAYLQMFSAKLRAAFDPHPLFRIGGDEFALIFHDTTQEEVMEIWKTLLQGFAGKQDGEEVAISSAFGCAFWDSDTLTTVDKIFKAADDRMYANKDATSRKRGH